MDDATIDRIVDKVVKVIKTRNRLRRIVPIEASARHLHLGKSDLEKLFGKGYKLTPVRELSQPGQFLCKERVNLIGPKGIIHNVAILGPVRNESQIEVSKTDTIILGIKALVRASGDIEGTPSIIISSDREMVRVEKGVIVPKRHIHMPPNIAKSYEIEDGKIVSVRVDSSRPVVFEDVIIRINNNYRLSMHIDFDEANACNFTQGIEGEILVKKGK